MNKIYYLLIGFLWFSTAAIGQENSWDQKQAFEIKRERSASFSIGGVGYVCAGLDTVLRNDLWQYDPAFDAWTQLSDLPGVARRNPVSFTINGKGYVGTGHSSIYSINGTPLVDFWEYDPALNSWLQIADYPGSGGLGIYFGTGFETTNYGYVACGKMGPSVYSDELWRYDPITNSWLQRDDFPGGDRYNLMSFVISDTAFVGFGIDLDNFRKDLWAYDEISNTWQQRADCGGVARAAGGTFSLNGRGFICCGVDGGFKEDLWEYNPAGDQWKIRAYFPTHGRRYGVSFALNGKGYFGCGKSSFGKKRSMYEYTPFSLFGWMMEELGVDEVDESTISIYPNPASNLINVDLTNTVDIDHIVMHSISGRIVGNYNVNGSSIEIDRGNKESGNYLLGFYNASNELVLTRKIMLK